jgi:hypothetical protein
MITARLIVALAIFMLAVFIAIMNWVWVFLNLRNWWRGTDESISVVPILSIIFLLLASIIAPQTDKGTIPLWIVVLVLLEPGNLLLIILPFQVLALKVMGKRSLLTKPKGNLSEHVGNDKNNL